MAKGSATKAPAARLNTGSASTDGPVLSGEQNTAVIAQAKKDRRRLERAYHGQLKRYFKRHYGYPKRARLARIEGEVWVEVIIDRQGKIVAHTLFRSSGSELLDNSALQDVAQLGSVPPPPSAVKWRLEGRRVRIPFVYKLRT